MTLLRKYNEKLYNNDGTINQSIIPFATVNGKYNPVMIDNIIRDYPGIEERKMYMGKYERNEIALFSLVSGILQYESIESKVVPLRKDLIQMVNKILYELSDRYYYHNWLNRNGTQIPFVRKTEEFLERTNEITTKYQSSFSRTLGLCLLVLEHLLAMSKKYDKPNRAEEPLDYLSEFFNSHGITLYDELEDSETIWNNIESKLL